MIKPLQSIKLKNDSGEDTTYVVASAPAIVETTEPASVASFSDGAAGIPVKSLIADINPVQSGTGDPSPSNVRPITGWTGMNVVRTGKNLFPYPYKESRTSISGLSFTDNGDGTITVSGTATATVYYNLFSNSADGCFRLKAGTYKIPATGDSQIQFNWYLLGGATLTTGNTERTFTLTSDSDVYCFLRFTSGVQYNSIIKPMLVIATETNLTYEPYTGTTYPISWQDEAGTVYGGTLDVTTGLLTVTHQIVDLGNLTWSYNSSSLYFNADLPVAIPKVSTNVIADILCTAYAPTKFADMYNNASGGDIMVSASNGTAGNKKVYVTDKAYTDPAAFKSAVAGVKLVYAVLTPTTYQLTPQAVLTILGQNNIWADTGDVEVDYCADTKLYIDKVIAAL